MRNDETIKDFIAANMHILHKSGIDISHIYNAVTKGDIKFSNLTKKSLLQIIKNKIEHTLYVWDYSSASHKTDLYPYLITSVQYKGGKFVYSYLRNHPKFRWKHLINIANGNDGHILHFKDGKDIEYFYRIRILKPSFMPYIEEIKGKLYAPRTAKILSEQVKDCLLPVLSFKHETKELTNSVLESIQCFLPGYPHYWLNRTDERIIENWEHCLNPMVTHGNDWIFNSDSIAQIIYCIIGGLKDLSDPTNLYWNQAIEESILNLKNL